MVNHSTALYFLCFIVALAAQKQIYADGKHNLKMDKFTIPVLKHELGKRAIDTKGVKAVLRQTLAQALLSEGLDPATYVSDFSQSTLAECSASAAANVGKQRGRDDGRELERFGSPALGDSMTRKNPQQGERDGGAVGDDADSVVSRCSSVRTKCSTSPLHSVASIRALEAAKRAELQARATFHKERRTVEEEELQLELERQKRKAQQEMELKEMELRQKLRTRRRKEELQIRQQLAEADAREKALRSVEEELRRSEESSRDVQPTSLNAEAPVFQPGQQQHSMADVETSSPPIHSCETDQLAETSLQLHVQQGKQVQQQQEHAQGHHAETERRNPEVCSILSRDAPCKPEVSIQTRSAPYRPEVANILGHDAPNRPEASNIPGHDTPHSTVQGSQIKEKSREHLQKASSIEELVAKQSLVMETLMNHQIRSLLPKLEMTKFSGNVTEYTQFIKTFDNNIGSKLKDDEERLAYLDQYLVGEAKELVRSCLLMPPSEGYDKARNLLHHRYGDPYRTVAILVDKIARWPSVKPGDAQGLDKLSMFLASCNSTVASGASSQHLDQPSVLRSILDKLPYGMQDRWRRKALKIRDSYGDVRFKDLASFIAEEARVLADPLFGRQNPDRKSRDVPRTGETGCGKSSWVMATNTNNQSKQRTCWYCEEEHFLEDCSKLRAKPMKERKDYILKNALCYGCIRKGHRVAVCTARKFCKLCGGRHPTLLHESVQATADSEEKSDDETEAQVKNGSVGMTQMGPKSQPSMPVIPVKVRVSGGKTVPTYAFLDSGSSACFCTESLLEELGASMDCTPTRLTLETVNPEVNKIKSFIINGIQVSDMEESSFLSLPAVYTLNTIPVSRDDIPTASELKVWSHLRELETPEIDSEIGLMIGNNVPEAMEPWDVIHGNKGEPFAVKTKLGWVVNGPMKHGNDSNIRFNRINVKEDVHEMFVRMYNDEFSDDNILEGKGMSQEDLVWMKKVESACKYTSEKHYQIPLPFRDENVQLPDNLEMARWRLESLKRKLSGDKRLHQDYKAFMEEMMKNGYAEEVQEEVPNKGHIWYLPHHGVRHPQKPEKLRVVFDCAAKFHDISLNDKLLQGPDLTNDLLDVLMRFRDGHVAFTADVEAMFYQVSVPREDRDFLRFLWWPNGDLEMRPKTFRMTVHLFGACSSPSCASYALQRTAKDHGMCFEDDIAQTIAKNFYVDDCLRSGHDHEKVTRLAHEVKRLCDLGGFNLTKFMSNDRSLLNSFPTSEQGKQVKAIDLNRDQLPEAKALGVVWIPEDDALVVKTEVTKRETTRRGILATVSSVYDPLGVAAPFILSGRKILQELCRLELEWDQVLPLHLEEEWRKWTEALPKFASFQINRCLVPRDFGDCTDVQLHLFSDASEGGFGSVAYLRLTNQQGLVWCSFLYGKARVAPLKTVTIPRLELAAAVMAVRSKKKIEKAMILDTSTFFWSDSMTVINYIRNKKTRFHTFVANRLKAIHEGSSTSQWRYVPGVLNPADEASRGCQTERWLKGPDFLWKPESEWPEQPQDEPKVSPSDPEVKANSFVVNDKSCTDDSENSRDAPGVVAADASIHPVQKLTEHYSSWYRLKKAVAWLMRARCLLQAKVRGKMKPSENDFTGSLTVDELQAAANLIIKTTQQQEFGEEIASLETSRVEGDEAKKPHVKGSSRLRSLDPMLEDGLLRVGGRLGAASMDYEAKHPLILSGTSHVTRLIIEDVHRRVGHQGREHVLAALRERFWVIKGNTAVRRALRACVRCRRLQLPVPPQKMSDLPRERTVSGLPPFTNSGVDLFGPFFVKRGRGQAKVYGVIFTCLATRAIHLEIADSLTTDSFINTLRRFIARRGEVKTMRSDRGTNLVGAERELRECIDRWNEKQLVETMRQRNIQWTFNPPSASHFGGIWERQIRTVRKILTAVLHEQTIVEDNLRTLFCEIEAIINSRPLTTVSDDPSDLSPLTPNHLLHQRSGIPLPPGIFDPADSISRKRWKQVQYLADIFWKRWSKEYLTALQERSKWRRPVRNLRDGDVVLVVENSMPRSQWRLGRIEKALPSSDGLVRKAKVRVENNVIDRPASKLVPLLDD